MLDFAVSTKQPTPNAICRLKTLRDMAPLEWGDAPAEFAVHTEYNLQ